MAAALLVSLVYQRSSIPDYAEAEALYPNVAEFGRVLADSRTGGVVPASTIEALIREDRFIPIQPYGVVFSGSPETLVTIRVNKNFSFEIARDGTPKWKKK